MIYRVVSRILGLGGAGADPGIEGGGAEVKYVHA